MKIPDFQR